MKTLMILVFSLTLASGAWAGWDLIWKDMVVSMAEAGEEIKYECSNNHVKGSNNIPRHGTIQIIVSNAKMGLLPSGNDDATVMVDIIIKDTKTGLLRTFSGLVVDLPVGRSEHIWMVIPRESDANILMEGEISLSSKTDAQKRKEFTEKRIEEYEKRPMEFCDSLYWKGYKKGWEDAIDESTFQDKIKDLPLAVQQALILSRMEPCEQFSPGNVRALDVDLDKYIKSGVTVVWLPEVHYVGDFHWVETEESKKRIDEFWANQALHRSALSGVSIVPDIRYVPKGDGFAYQLGLRFRNGEPDGVVFKVVE